MRITGTLHSTGTHELVGDHNAEVLSGILVTADDETLRAASNLLCATVDIYPHPVNGLVAGECTPENYAHALARLAHAEDHLAREVRSSQALAAALEKLQAEHDALAGIAHDLRIKLVTAEYTAGKACQALAELSSIYDDAGGEAQAIMCEWDTSGNSAGEHAARRVVDAFT